MSKKKRKADKREAFAHVSNSEFDWIVYTDGGCEYNPGGAGGIGAVIIDTETGEIQEISQGYMSTTNNRMEIRAALTALQMLPDNCNVMLYSDSQYLLNTISGVWQKKKNRDLWKQLEKELKRVGHVFCHWVRGHNGDPCNERCDELASQAMHGDLIWDQGFDSGEFDQDYVDVNRLKSEAGISNKKKPIPDIPEEINGVWIDATAEELSEKTGVHKSCAQLICSFYKKEKHGFADYKNLKTGGIDQLSRKPKDYLVGIFGEEVWNAAESVLGDDAIKAMRWHARGLVLSDALRKVQVDNEVAENCMLRY